MKLLLTTAAIGLLSFSASAEVPYLTGGVGEEEMQSIQTQAYKYNLQVKSAYTTGHYVADVMIEVVDASGAPVLQASADGPLFYAKLDAGTYTIKGTLHSEVQSQKITIGSDTKLREVMLRFKPLTDPVN